MTITLATPARFLQRFIPMVGAGLLGTLGLTPLILDQLAALPAEAQIDLGVAVGLVFMQTGLLVAAAAAIGAACMPRIGLRSLLARPRLPA